MSAAAHPDDPASRLSQSNHATALAWLNARVPVFPCGADKRPVVRWRPKGTDGRSRPLTIEEAQAAHRLRKAVGSMPGVDCQAIGALVVDLDGKGNGIANFEAFCREHGIDIGDCPTARTPTGGVHLFFADPDGRWRNSAGEIAPGVDTRGVGGYVVAVGAVRRGVGIYESVRPAALAEFIDIVASGRLPAPAPRLAALLDAHCLSRSFSADAPRLPAASPTVTRPHHDPRVDPSRPLTLPARFAGVPLSVNDGLFPGLPERWTLERALAAVAASAPGTRNDTFAREAFTAGLRAQALGLEEDETVDALIGAAKAAGSDDAKTVDTITRCFSAGTAQAAGSPREAWVLPAQTPRETSPNAAALDAIQLRAAHELALRAAKSRLRDTFLTATIGGSRQRVRDALVLTAIAIVDVQVRAKLAFTLATLLLKSGHSDADIVEAVIACRLPRAQGLNALRWALKNVPKGEAAWPTT
jgi:hypothetical protein